MQVFTLVIVTLLLEETCYGQITGKQEKAPVIKEGIRLIQCQVCQNLIREASRSVNKLRDEHQPGKVTIWVRSGPRRLC